MSAGQQCRDEIIDHLRLPDDAFANLRRQLATRGRESFQQCDIVRVRRCVHRSHGRESEKRNTQGNRADASGDSLKINTDVRGRPLSGDAATLQKLHAFRGSAYGSCAASHEPLTLLQREFHALAHRIILAVQLCDEREVAFGFRTPPFGIDHGVVRSEQVILHALCEHAAGNYRLLTTMAAELLAAGAQRQLPVLDEKLYLEIFAPPKVATRRPGASR